MVQIMTVVQIGDSYENRTRVTAVKGRCLDRLTKEPFSFVVVVVWFLVAAVGFEPTTCRVWTGRYRPTKLRRHNGCGGGTWTSRPPGYEPDELPTALLRDIFCLIWQLLYNFKCFLFFCQLFFIWFSFIFYFFKILFYFLPV